MTDQPTPEMLDALQSFANRHGRRWKSVLSLYWMNGRDEMQPEGGRLRAVRNQLGPTWLHDKCRIKPAPKP